MNSRESLTVVADVVRTDVLGFTNRWPPVTHAQVPKGEYLLQTAGGSVLGRMTIEVGARAESLLAGRSGCVGMGGKHV